MFRPRRAALAVGVGIVAEQAALGAELVEIDVEARHGSGDRGDRATTRALASAASV